MATYSFKSVNCALVGPTGVVSLGNGSGNAEEGITIEPTEEINEMAVGADGTPMHSLRANKSGKAIVRLLKVSPVNAVLQAMLNAQTADPALHGNNTITTVDKLRGDAVTCEQCAFAKQPAIVYAKAGGMMEWEFHVGRLGPTLGAGV